MNEVLTTVLEHKEEIIGGAALVYEVVARKTPTEKSLSLVTFLGNLLGWFIKDKAKGGGEH